MNISEARKKLARLLPGIQEKLVHDLYRRLNFSDYLIIAGSLKPILVKESDDPFMPRIAQHTANIVFKKKEPLCYISLRLRDETECVALVTKHNFHVFDGQGFSSQDVLKFAGKLSSPYFKTEEKDGQKMKAEAAAFLKKEEMKKRRRQPISLYRW